MIKGWYILNVFSGQEKRVQERIGAELDRAPALAELIVSIKLPMEEREEIRNSQRRKVTRRFLPGYLLVQLEASDEQWADIVTGICSLEGVMGFLGFRGGKIPRPLPVDEVRRILQRSGEINSEKRVVVNQEFSVGEEVKIIEGAFESFSGIVEEALPAKGKLRLQVSIFDRSVPVDLDFSQVQKKQEY